MTMRRHTEVIYMLPIQIFISLSGKNWGCESCVFLSFPVFTTRTFQKQL